MKKKVRNIKKRNTKKRIFRRKKTKRKNSKKRKSRRMRGGADNELTAEQKDQLLQATTDDDFFNLAKSKFEYTVVLGKKTDRKNSVIKMLKKLKNNVEELEQLKSDKEGVDSDLAKVNQDLETLNTMASNDQKQKPPGEFIPKFNTIADKLVNLSEKEGELGSQLAQLRRELAAKVEELKKVKEEHASAMTEKESQLETARSELKKADTNCIEGLLKEPTQENITAIEAKIIQAKKKLKLKEEREKARLEEKTINQNKRDAADLISFCPNNYVQNSKNKHVIEFREECCNGMNPKQINNRYCNQSAARMTTRAVNDPLNNP